MSSTARLSLVKMLIKNKMNQQQQFRQQTQKSYLAAAQWAVHMPITHKQPVSCPDPTVSVPNGFLSLSTCHVLKGIKAHK